MQAYKCDCCGALFTYEEYGQVNANRTVQAYTCNTKGRNFDQMLDLCYRCQLELEKLLGNALKFDDGYSTKKDG